MLSALGKRLRQSASQISHVIGLLQLGVLNVRLKRYRRHFLSIDCEANGRFQTTLNLNHVASALSCSEPEVTISPQCDECLDSRSNTSRNFVSISSKLQGLRDHKVPSFGRVACSA